MHWIAYKSTTSSDAMSERLIRTDDAEKTMENIIKRLNGSPL